MAFENRTQKAEFAPKLKSLPPTFEAFMENVKCAHLQACIWKSALHPNHPHVEPTEFSWFKDEGNKVLIPTTVLKCIDAAPASILDIRCNCGSDKACSTTRCGCDRTPITCTVFCKCQETLSCLNPLTDNTGAVSDDDDDRDETDDEANDNN